MSAPLDPAIGMAGMLVDAEFKVNDITPTGFYLACFSHKSPGAVLWWGPDQRGYTPDLDQAGVYTYEEAAALDHSSSAVPVPAAMIDELRVRRIVDPGDSLNSAFWTAKGLRSHLAATGRWVPMIEPGAMSILPRRQPGADRRALERLLFELHRDGILSEQQCAKRLDVDLVTWRGVQQSHEASSREHDRPENYGGSA